jgi:hypothetical protein
MSRHQAHCRRCTFESLESRQMLAGDVTARIVNGDLIIKGDRNANEIAVTQSGTTITVVGTGTTVNSGTSAAVITGFTGSIKLKMKGGDDDVTLTGLTATELDAGLGKGNDTLDIENCTINGDTELEGRKGNDTITVDIATGGETPITSRFNGELDIDLGKGEDTLRMVRATVTGEAEIEGGRGVDNVNISGSNFTTLETDLGRGDDSLAISTTTVSVKTDLDGGKGTNTFTSTGNTLTGLTQKNFTEVV